MHVTHAINYSLIIINAVIVLYIYQYKLCSCVRLTSLVNHHHSYFSFNPSSIPEIPIINVC